MNLQQGPNPSNPKISSLEDFLRSKKESPNARELQAQWDARKERWMRSIHDLYRTIEGWLDHLKKKFEQSVSYETRDGFVIFEENLGQYQVPYLFIVLGGQRLVLSPRGTNIVGGVGRVDIVGMNGSKALVMKEWDDWQFFEREVKSPTNVVLHYEALTEESFNREVLDLIIEQWPH